MSWFRRRSRAADGDVATEAAEATETAETAETAEATQTAEATETGETGEAADARQPDAGPDATHADAAAGDGAAGGSRAPAEEVAPDRSEGPFDVAEVDDEVQRIDLGALRVPAAAGAELRLEVEDKTQRVVSATVVLRGSTLQLQAFAAPRTAGVWSEIRAEIATQVGKQGGSAQETPGPFGVELLARLPARTADGRTGHRAARFVGVDGPRWFLRGVLGGAAAADAAAAADLEAVLRGTVVVRGAEAMAPRDLLALTLPPDAARVPGAPGGTAPAGGPGAGGAGDGGAGDGGAGDGDDQAGRGEDDPPPRPRLAPPERGPEITERR